MAIVIRQTTILISNCTICAGSLTAILYATNPILITLLLIDVAVLYTVEFNSNMRLYNVNNVNVNYESFQRRLTGGKSKAAAAPKHNGRLTQQEKNALVLFMLSLNAVGIGGTLKTVRTTAINIHRRRP